MTPKNPSTSKEYISLLEEMEQNVVKNIDFYTQEATKDSFWNDWCANARDYYTRRLAKLRTQIGIMKTIILAEEQEKMNGNRKPEDRVL